MAVTPDAARRPLDRAGKARDDYYVHDRGRVRIIVLDTSCRAGGADGCRVLVVFVVVELPEPLAALAMP